MNKEISVSKIKLVISLFLLAVWMLLLVSTFMIARTLRLSIADALVTIFHTGVLRCFNLECIVEGAPVTARPTLYISNHISYLDIFALGSKLPGTFIAKSEVAKWPLFGVLAKLQGTLFIERKGQKVGDQIQQMQQHLQTVGNLFLFPEGTSNIGTFVAPFKSSFFQAAAGDQSTVIIQPLTIAYTTYRNQPMNRRTRDYYAWYSPRKILNHFLNGLGLGRAQVKLIAHEPVRFESFESRKDLSNHCEAVIRQGLLDAIGLDEEIVVSQTHH